MKSSKMKDDNSQIDNRKGHKMASQNPNRGLRSRAQQRKY